MSIQEEGELLNKLPSLDLLYNHALDQSQFIIPPCLYFNSLFFAVASTMGLRGLKIERETNRGNKTIIPNFLGISFGKSGMGKDHVYKLTTKMFSSQYDRFAQLADQFYDARNQNPAMPDKRYVKLPSYFIDVTSSEQGIQKAAQTISDMGVGSVNIISDELGDNMGIMDPIFRKLKTAWDDGVSNGPITVSDGGANYFSIENITYNAMLYGSPEIFDLKKDLKDRLIQAYISGMTRRSFVYHNIWYKKSEMRNKDFEIMTTEDMKQADEYLSDLKYFMNNTDKIKLPRSVHQKLQQYDEEKQIERETSKSPIAESLGSALKIEKLLGIIATIELSETITEDHLNWAIEFTEIIDKTTESTVRVKPMHVLIYQELEKNEFVSRTDIVREVKGVTLKSLEDEMILVEEYANQVGNSIIKKSSHKIISYKLEKMSKASLDSCLISVNPDGNKTNPKGFSKMRGEFLKLHNIINSEYRYSAGTFRGEYINDDNYMQEQNLFIIDVDDGMTIDEAKNLFSDWTYLITTTKSHQKPKGKNKVVNDRFRIIMPTLSTFHLNPQVYSKMYENVLSALNIPYDESCKNASRWYYGNNGGEHWYNEGDLLDVRNFIPDTIEQQESKSSLENYENSDGMADLDARVDGAVRWFLQNTQEGNRHDNLFRFCMLLKDPNRIACQDWENTVKHANSCLAHPISDNDLNSTIKSASRR